MKNLKLTWLFIILFTVYGCAPPPGMGPIPPMLSGPAIMGLGWIILGIIALFAIIAILKNTYDKKPKNVENLAKTLNDINERLKKLEDDVKQLKKHIKKGGST